jgi:hypothetical protein
MAQLTIDVDYELLSSGIVPDTARARKFGSKNFKANERKSFVNARDVPQALVLRWDGQQLFFEPDEEHSFRPPDRIVVVTASSRGGNYYHWHDGAALMAEHFISRADPRFLASFPIELPAYIETEVSADTLETRLDDGLPSLVRELLLHALFTQVFLLPPLRGLARLLQREHNCGMTLDGVLIPPYYLATDDGRARSSLVRALGEASTLLEDQLVANATRSVEEIVNLIEAGEPLGRLALALSGKLQ